MKKLLLLLVMGCTLISFGQIPSYYNDVNLSLSGQSLKSELATKVTNTQTNILSYTPGVWDALKQTDLDPTNSSRVVLIYGFSDTDGNSTTDRTRGINNNGGGSTDWNREHTYPKSLANPNLGTTGAGADAHNLRPSDVQRNSSRGSRKFADGSGNSGTTSQGHWYPGDEFKGDVARMMMFMYIRYGNRCLPSNVGIGASVSGDTNMIQLFLEWNADDPVSQLELQRNPIIENLQGNRNPFIDNPAFATQIWGGPQAEDRFGTAGSDTQAPSIPSALVASNTTTTSTQLSWNTSTDNIGVTGYDVYRNGSFLNSTTTTNYPVTGLSAATTYSFSVRAKDAAGNVSAFSSSINVTAENTSGGGNTLCNSTITSFPYTESFENTLGAWKQATSGDDFNWAIRSGSTPSSNTGPSSANAGSYYIYMESSTPNYSNKRAIVYSPCYDITNASLATFSFKYHMYGTSAMGSLTLEASLDGTTWTSIWSTSGNQGNSWKTATIDLASYAGEKVQLRFNGITGTTWQGDMAVDAVNFSTSGNTGGGSTTTDVNLRITFDNYPEETSWEIRNNNNQVVYSGGTYGAQADGSTLNILRTLDTGCYTLIVKDVYGDGICCNYGNGSYALTDSSSGTILVSGGSFGTQDSNNFCVGSASRNFSETTVKEMKPTVFNFRFYPNPVIGEVIIQLENTEKADYKIINQIGQVIKVGKVIKEPIKLNGLPSGMYFISVNDGKRTVSKKFVKK
ncbi:T9SS C-terminal target domain-containing protein [Aquimarina sp. BL5]|uniref:endonuclease n=1 Tax=Aquimarina sp. BL5 TaxID=1714860 RepID=UPI000E54EFC0|nr:endonuclease [Aquimarina sp. BL5]AXT53684.1 T9SS C-terminal target domain-containing protein [Aquimarina sp. BL5]RKM91588.1 T9SS C-terminal target domain-containing protein [Aquimarina sp. BL5]